jgi:hypothetical protein
MPEATAGDFAGSAYEFNNTHERKLFALTTYD